MKRILFLPLLLLSGFMMGQNPITTAVPFLSVSPDARGAGLAGCGTATEADVFSMYYNPAKYAFVEGNTLAGGGYNRWLAGETNLFNAAVAQRVGRQSTLAATFRYFNGMSVEYLDPTGQFVGTYAPSDFAVDLPYAIRVNEVLSLALAGRYIQSSAGEQYYFSSFNEIKKGRSFAADLGIYYRKPLSLGGLKAHFAFGASINNIGSKISYWASPFQLVQYKTAIPTTLRFGTSLKTKFADDHILTGMVDFTKLLVPFDIPVIGCDVSVFKGMLRSFYDAPGGFKEELSEINYGIGLEYAWKETVFVRTGYFNQPYLKGNRKYLSLGLGAAFGHFGVDASYEMSTTSYHNSDYLVVGTHFNL